jgi:hypothetical protein
MADRRGSNWGAIVALAFLALFTRIAVPPGFMPKPGDGPGLIVCTGHGPATVRIGLYGPPSRAPTHKTDPPCAFAPSGATSAPALIAASLPARRLASIQARPITRSDLAPGRGLAAPPPPSQAPPRDLT